jgi:hypothetical protein
VPAQGAAGGGNRALHLRDDRPLRSLVRQQTRTRSRHPQPRPPNQPHNTHYHPHHGVAAVRSKVWNPRKDTATPLIHTQAGQVVSVGPCTRRCTRRRFGRASKRLGMRTWGYGTCGWSIRGSPISGVPGALLTFTASLSFQCSGACIERRGAWALLYLLGTQVDTPCPWGWKGVPAPGTGAADP